MNAAVELIAILLLGIGAFAATRISRARHVAKFGPAPEGFRGWTITWFLGCSVVMAILAWWSAIAFGVLLVSIVFLSYIVGFRARAWGPWQQFRDGAVFSVLFSAPLILIGLWVLNA